MHLMKRSEIFQKFVDLEMNQAVVSILIVYMFCRMNIATQQSILKHNTGQNLYPYTSNISVTETYIVCPRITMYIGGFETRNKYLLKGV
jgi:hypothetical protein